LSHEVSAAVRRLAVQRVARGERPSTVIASYGLCRTTIYRWLRAARAGGLDALAARRHPGTKPRVGFTEALDLRGALLGRTPGDHGLPGSLWTRRTVAALVRHRTGRRIGSLAAGRLLRRIGLDRRSPPAFAGAEGRPCVLLATDGRGAFLCTRVADPSRDALVRRVADSLARRAGRPVTLSFVVDAVPPP
jgi:transposase